MRFFIYGCICIFCLGVVLHSLISDLLSQNAAVVQVTVLSVQLLLCSWSLSLRRSNNNLTLMFMMCAAGHRHCVDFQFCRCSSCFTIFSAFFGCSRGKILVFRSVLNYRITNCSSLVLPLVLFHGDWDKFFRLFSGVQESTDKTCQIKLVFTLIRTDPSLWTNTTNSTLIMNYSIKL